MKGRDRFTKSEAGEIKRLLRHVRGAAPGTPQKVLRDQLRRLGFYISDWADGPRGFTPSDFDYLVSRGAITITDGGPPADAQPPVVPAPATPRPPGRATPRPSNSHAAVTITRPALAALSRPPLSIKEAVAGGVPNRPGLYAIYGPASVWSTLGLGQPPDDRPLYVGKAEASLVSRDLNTHFATGTTGRSSPRRSLAALLSATGTLELVATPRRPRDPEPGKWTHYGLEAAGDEQLASWMQTNLRIAVWAAPTGTNLRPIERAAMHHWLPPLNLTGVSTPWTAQVKTARSGMADQARAWARERGFDA